MAHNIMIGINIRIFDKTLYLNCQILCDMDIQRAKELDFILKHIQFNRTLKDKEKYQAIRLEKNLVDSLIVELLEDGYIDRPSYIRFPSDPPDESYLSITDEGREFIKSGGYTTKLTKELNEEKERKLRIKALELGNKERGPMNKIKWMFIGSIPGFITALLLAYLVYKLGLLQQ